jgi:hypothetical protein
LRDDLDDEPGTYSGGSPKCLEKATKYFDNISLDLDIWSSRYEQENAEY